MPGSCSRILLVFIAFLLNDLASGEVDDLSCETFCLSRQAICTCTVTGGILIWEVKDENDNSIGSQPLDIDNLNTPVTVNGAPAFQAVLTGSTKTTLTATLSFTTLSEYEGYTLECNSVANPLDVTVSIPGPPLSVTDLKLAGFTSSSVMLTFTAPTSSPCISNYTVETNANALSSTTGTSVTITKPENDPDDATYSVSVTAVDLAGRMGDKASLHCFMFSGPNAVIFANNVDYMMQGDNCTAQIEWTSENCSPEVTSYDVTINSNGNVSTEVVFVPSISVISIPVGRDLTVTVIPSNVLGLGSPTSTTFAVPTNCLLPAMVDDGTTTSTSGSTAVHCLGSGGFPFGAVLGTFIAFAVSWIGI